MTDTPLHLIKLVVGINSIAELAAWQEKEYLHYKGQKVGIVHTRYKPRRAEEILATQGSIYRVIRGYIMCREHIIGFETTEDDKRGKHCLILTDTSIMRTYPTLHRPFQGWRYMKNNHIPKDTERYTPEQGDGVISLEEEHKKLCWL